MTNTISRTIADETLNRIIQIESAGNPNAKAPTSSAAGLGQFINSTWTDTVRHYRPDLIKSGTFPSRVGAATAALQIEMLARFTEANAKGLGAGCTDGDLYLAHFLGLGDARKLLRSVPGTMAAAVVSAGAVSANRSILSGKNCGEVRNWAQNAMVSRWEKAGKPDWVKRYAGSPVTLPDAPKPAPKDITTKTATDTTKIGGGAAAGGAVIIAGGAAANQAGWGIMEWSIVIVGLILAIGLGVYAWHRWKEGQKAAEIRTGGTQAVASALFEPAATKRPEAIKTAVATPVSHRRANKRKAAKKRAPKKAAKKRRA